MSRTSNLIVVLIVALALPAVGAPSPVAQATVTKVAVEAGPGRVQMTIAATAPVAYRAMTLADPDRLVVDIPNAVNGVQVPVVPVHRGLVVQVRVAQFMVSPPVVRVVVDLMRPVRYEVAMPAPTVVAVTMSPSSPGGTLHAMTSSPLPPDAGVERPTVPVSAGPGNVVGQRVMPAGEKLNLDLRDAGLADVLDALARLCGLNLVTDGSVTGRVTLHLVGVTCEEALRFLLEANGLGFRRVGETLIVQAAAKLTLPPPVAVVRVYKLQYVQPPFGAVEALVGSVGATAVGGAGISGGAGPVKKDVGALLDLFKGTGAQVAYDDRLNALIATGTPAQQEAVGELVRILDVPIPQVMVEAMVVDITSTSLRDLGIEWSVLQSSTGTPFTFQEVPPPPAGQLGLQPIARDALLAKLHAFVAEGLAKVLSTPRVATPDGQQALIFAGDQIPIVNTTTAGNPPVTAQTVTFQPIGVTLKITPKVNADRSVTVQIHPVVTTQTSSVTPTGGTPLPIISIREAVTTLRVAEGSSLILGGLMRYSDIVNLKKIPFLGDLPFLGSLFRLTNVTHTESEVVIIMTPRILATGTPVQ